MSKSTAAKRSDARRNRDAILTAALEAMTESPNASLNAIAKRAGVANATLYRHFPTREELVLAVYEHEVQRLVDAAACLLQEQAPIDALRSWVADLARYAVTKHGLADALRKATTPGSDLASTGTSVAIVAALDRLLQANIEAGTLRAGLDPDDVILALAGLWQLDPGRRLESPGPAYLRHRPQRPATIRLTPKTRSGAGTRKRAPRLVPSVAAARPLIAPVGCGREAVA